MRRLIVTIFALTGLILSIPQTSHSIPAFARKYGFNCNMCHVSFTKLNDFGQRYRENGYQIPGQEGTEKNVFEIAPPLALRLAVGHAFYNAKTTTPGQEFKGPSTSGFHLYAFDLFGAGVMHKNVSFLMIYKPRTDAPEAFAYNNSGPNQSGTLESANIVFSNLVQNAVNLRIGLLEPAYQAISSRRSFYLVEPYEIYNFPAPYDITTPFETPPPSSRTYGSNQIGMEASGHFNFGFKYGLGVVNGNGLNPDNNTYRDVYLNLFQVIGKGDGQSAGQRLGLFAYYGWTPSSLFAEPDTVAGNAHGLDNRPYSRVGGNASLNWRSFNLSALFLAGKDDKKLNILDPSKSYDYNGGFAELDYSGLINNRLLLSALYNWVQPPSYDNRKISAISGLVRYYLGDWTAVNVALHGEYTHRMVGKGDFKAREDVVTALIDFDF